LRQLFRRPPATGAQHSAAKAANPCVSSACLKSAEAFRESVKS
jgi:hypothetical protein